MLDRMHSTPFERFPRGPSAHAGTDAHAHATNGRAYATDAHAHATADNKPHRHKRAQTCAIPPRTRGRLVRHRNTRG